MMKEINKGQRFYGPDGQFYEFTQDIRGYDQLWPKNVIAGGGAPEPMPGAPAPHWFLEAIFGS